MPSHDSPALRPWPWFGFAAAGALLFGVALAAGAWFYVIRLAPGAGHAPMTPGVAAWNTALFSLFALHHSLMARSGAKAWLTSRLPTHAERSVFVWTASLLFLAVCAAWRPTREVAWTLPGPVAVLGVATQLFGLGVTTRAAGIVDVWELAGLRQGAPLGPRSGGDPVPADAPPGAQPESHPLDVISVRGPYRFVRHPIYCGWLLLVWAVPVMSSGRLLFALVSTAYLVVAIPLEERSLVAIHGDDYRRYQRLVRWRLLPGVF